MKNIIYTFTETVHIIISSFKNK